MKYLAISLLLLLANSLIGQNSKQEETLSSLEGGLSFETYRNYFSPRINMNFYRSETNILHFSPSFKLDWNQRDISSWSISNDFWNEYRRYIGQSGKFFLSRGFTMRAAFSTIDNFFVDENRIEWSGASLAFGYRLGIGYRIDRRFTFMGTINPRANFQILDDEFDFSSSIKLQAPLNFGLNYRF